MCRGRGRALKLSALNFPEFCIPFGLLKANATNDEGIINEKPRASRGRAGRSKTFSLLQVKKSAAYLVAGLAAGAFAGAGGGTVYSPSTVTDALPSAAGVTL